MTMRVVTASSRRIVTERLIVMTVCMECCYFKGYNHKDTENTEVFSLVLCVSVVKKLHTFTNFLNPTFRINPMAMKNIIVAEPP